MTTEEAKQIGKMRKSMAPGQAVIADEIRKLREDSKREVTNFPEPPEVQKTEGKSEVTNFPDVQKTEGMAKITNWPNIFKVVGEVVAKVAFPPIQKIVGTVTAKIDNFPKVQKIEGDVKAKVDFPDIQDVNVKNPVEKMYVEGRTEITNLPLGKGKDKKGNPENFVSIRLTDGVKFYDLTDMVLTGGGGSAVSYADPDQRWIREDFTYDADNNVTKAMAYDGKGFMKTVDFEYDGSGNMTRKSVRTEKAS